MLASLEDQEIVVLHKPELASTTQVEGLAVKVPVAVFCCCRRVTAPGSPAVDDLKLSAVQAVKDKEARIMVGINRMLFFIYTQIGEFRTGL